MTSLPILFPFKGASDAQAFSDQPAETSSELLNVRGVDPRTGRKRGSRRPGLQKYVSSALNTATKVKDLCSVTYDVPRTSFTATGAGSEETRWSAASPTKTDTIGIATDRQGNVYVIDGASGIAKYNPDGLLLWKHPLPIVHKDHLVRALWVDDTDRIYAAVSANGEQATAKAWCYTQNDDTTKPVTLLWELTPGAFVERMKVKGDKLYTLQNKPDRGKSSIVAYEDIDTSDPEEAFRRDELPFPANDFDTGPDGAIFVACEPNATRGFDPMVPESTPGGEDWTPKELANYAKRIWSWHDAKEPDAFAVNRLPGADDDEGGTITVFYDKSGKGRHYYSSSVANESGPTYRTLGVGGYPSAHFNGSTNAMESALPTSIEKAHKADQLCTIPNYSGAQFALFIAFRAPIEVTVRWLLGFDGATDRGILVNRMPGAAIPGTAVAGELSLYEENAAAGTVAASVTVPGAPTGGRPSPGFVGSNGVTVVTWICDGGVHDVFGSATRSTLRINGWPMDRWQSAEFSATVAARLGKVAQGSVSGFSGDVAEIFCLSDWEDASGVTQRLLTVPEYPDVNFAASSDTECERIEGYLANKWRAADQLPGGKASVFTCTATPVAGDTVTVGSNTYTYVAPGALVTARQVSVGVSMAEALSNLRHAINHTGRPGVDYGSSTIASTEARALGPFLAQGAADYRLVVVQRNPHGAAIATTDVTATGSWNAATTSTSINPTLGGNNGFYPHPFYYRRTGSTLSVGGPPRAAGASTISKVLLLNTVYGILAKIDPSNGAVKWVATSDFDGAGSGVGGVGFGCLCASDGTIFSVGPRQAAVSAGVTGANAILADAVDVRKLGDSGSAFVTAFAGTGDPWQATPGDPTYHYPRMARDTFDNVYVPIFNAAATVSAIVYARASNPVGSGTPNALVTLNNLTSDPQAHACIADPLVPSYPTGSNPSRAESFYLVTRNAGVAAFATIYKVRIVTTTLSAGSNRAMANLGACGSDLKTFAAPATVATPTGGAGAIDATARYVNSTSIFQKIYIVDGKKTLVFDPLANTVGELTSDGPGTVPQRCKIIGHYGGRLVLARDVNDPQNWHMSAKDNPRNWNVFPNVITASQAARGNLPDGPGRSPDIVNTFIRYTDDLAFFGGDHSIQRVTGNPTLLGGGRIDLISDTIGIAWGRCWTKDSEGNLYFFGSRGGVYVILQGASAPVSITEGLIDDQMRDVDLANYYIGMGWDDDPNHRGLHVWQFPFGAGGTHVRGWFWDKRLAAWFPDEYGSSTMTSIQPTAVHVVDGDDVDDRVLLVGCEDGFVRFFDPDATNGDDGQVIETSVMMGPFSIPEFELRVSGLRAVLANDQAGLRYEVFASDEPDVPGHAVCSGEFGPGMNPIDWSAGARGAYLWVRIQQATSGEPWSLESMAFENVMRTGRRRVRTG